MLKTVLFLILFLFGMIFPLKTWAHGGVEKTAGNVLVTLFQTPLSPFVGEKVNFAFILSDQTKRKMLVNKSARLVITKTFTGDASKDKVVFTQEVKSDINGTINFTYTFPSTDYYDIDLEFGKPNDEANTTGFLVQPRKNLQNSLQFLEIFLVISIIINFIFLLYLLRNILRTLRS